MGHDDLNRPAGSQRQVPSEDTITLDDILLSVTLSALHANQHHIDINNMLVEKVASFTYLGSLITDDTECAKDIRGRLAKCLGTGAKLERIWQNHGMVK